MALERSLREVHEHLGLVLQKPSTSLDERLLEHIDRQVSEAIDDSKRSLLLNQLSELLPTLQQDPTPLTELIERLVAPDAFTFANVLRIQPAPDFSLGLGSPSPAVNKVTLTLLAKATRELSDVNYVAGRRGIVGSLVEKWLGAEATGVAHKASQVLINLLLWGRRAKETTPVDPAMDHNLMWRRVFRDRDIYQAMFSACSLQEENGYSTRHTTVAQGRLLDLLLAVRTSPVRTSQIAEIESQYGVKDGGLLEYALIHMIDYKNDDLMLSTLFNFCINYIRPDPDQSDRDSSASLDLLKKHGLHRQCLSYFLQQSQIAASWVLSDSAIYIGTYCSSHRSDLLSDPTLPNEILSNLRNHISNTPSEAWNSSRIPNTDLLILSHLPQSLLATALYAESSPLILLPPVETQPAIVNTLSQILSASSPQIHSDDKAAARVLYYLYLKEHPSLWPRIMKAADTVALLDPALAANNFIKSIITADWAPLPSSATPPNKSNPFPLPPESWLRNHYHSTPLPSTGVEAIMMSSSPSSSGGNISEVILPYLMKPAQTFGNAVGGGRGDVESAAWKVAVAKYEVLEAFLASVKRLDDESTEMREMIAAVSKRVAEGPMGGSTGVGGMVGTMEL
ncbi:MAG: hypothetical protein OHK93_003591 [Ramalina farinacea]|uniref:Uncharacterized protein n=1 Tax=Ramalina farinacea TaxID=258253 RepID=A0AA43U1D9_9LECA|nr:hypothetical protein [Ramalina farinacea]